MITLADIRTAAEKRGMSPEQITKLLYPYKISIFIDEQRAAGMGRKDILSNVHYLTEREFNFDTAVKFSALVEDYLTSKSTSNFAEFFRAKASAKAAGK